MSNDAVDCPYCYEEYIIDADDVGEDGESSQTRCPACAKTFMLTTTVRYIFSSSKADCVNSLEPHKWRNGVFSPSKKCTVCGEVSSLSENERREQMERMK